MKSAKHLFLALGLIAALFGGLATAKPVSACSCIAGQTTQDNFDNSAAVFVGTVTKISEGSAANSVEFDVSRSWKGSVASEVTISTASNSAACGFDFLVGGEYLVYAYYNDGLETGLCSGTADTASVASAIAELNQISEGTSIPEEEESAEEEMDDTTKSVVIAALSLVVGALVGYGLGKKR